MVAYSYPAPRAASIVPRVVCALILLAAGLGLGAYGALGTAQRFADPLTAPYQSGQFTQQLQPGRYLVYAPPATHATAAPAGLKVVSPAGAAIPVAAYGGDETQTRGSTTFSAYAQFQAPSAGTYRFSLAGGLPRIIVARTLWDSAKPLLRPAAEAAAGAAILLAGSIVLGKALVRRWWRVQDARTFNTAG